MKAFAHLSAKSWDAASKALAQGGGVARAGGTDLLDLLKERLLEPGEVVSVRDAEGVYDGPAGLSALDTLADVAADPWIRENFPVVAQAAGEAATPQIRNVGTVGGNLCQHTRCWFFRNKPFPCFKRGTGACSAMEEGAHNRYHAIFPSPRCASAHPSNLAPALIAVDARIRCVHPDGNRTMDLGLLYEDPREGVFGDTVLRPGELIDRVFLQPTPLARNSTYVEFRERLSFDFAAASVAAALHREGGAVADARIVCGAVAPRPYRATAAEDALKAGASPAEAAEAAVKGAEPLEENKYKVPILRRLIRGALEELWK